MARMHPADAIFDGGGQRYKMAALLAAKDLAAASTPLFLRAHCLVTAKNALSRHGHHEHLIALDAC